MTALDSFLADSQRRINQVLQQQIADQGSPFIETTAAVPALERLREAEIYSVSNGGKRLRPALVYAVCQAFAPHLPAQDQDLLAASLECIHGYSLVHDDLPAMDDDELRRGQPTCHIAYDEATAILVGDGLQALAFELLSRLQSVRAATVVELVGYLARAAGSFGMVGGQMIDLQSVNQALDLEQLQNMHRLKTGALIQAAVLMPAIAGELDERHRRALADYAAAIGLAFQVHDDVLDIEADTDTLGKTQGADLRLNKPTYPALLGLDGAKQKADDLIRTAHQALAAIESADNAALLHDLADFITARHF